MTITYRDDKEYSIVIYSTSNLTARGNRSVYNRKSMWFNQSMENVSYPHLVENPVRRQSTHKPLFD